MRDIPIYPHFVATQTKKSNKEVKQERETLDEISLFLLQAHVKYLMTPVYSTFSLSPQSASPIPHTHTFLFVVCLSCYTPFVDTASLLFHPANYNTHMVPSVSLFNQLKFPRYVPAHCLANYCCVAHFYLLSAQRQIHLIFTIRVANAAGVVAASRSSQ